MSIPPEISSMYEHFTKSIFSLTLNLSAFFLAKFRAFSFISVATILAFVLRASMMLIIPLPVPISAIFGALWLLAISSTLSTKISVSGRGIKTPLSISNSSP